MDPALRDALGDPRAIVQFDEATVTPSKPGSFTTLRLAADPLFDERVEYVEGAPPGPIAEAAPIDIALSEQTAEQTGWAVDEVRTLGFPGGVEVPVRLSGVFRPIDPTDAD